VKPFLNALQLRVGLGLCTGPYCIAQPIDDQPASQSGRTEDQKNRGEKKFEGHLAPQRRPRGLQPATYLAYHSQYLVGDRGYTH